MFKMILLYLVVLFLPFCCCGKKFASPFDDSAGTNAISVTPKELRLPPGKEADLGITLQDIYDTFVEEVFRISITDSSSNIFIETTPLLQIGCNKVKFLGERNSSSYLLISSLKHNYLNTTIELSLSECPPGYFFQSNRCLCSANSRNRSYRYIGIENCQPLSFQAALRYGHWAGYVEEHGEERFQTGFCPNGFCAAIGRHENDVLLPSDVREESNLSEQVCRENREGILCSRCVANCSASFTTYRDCHLNHNCHLGWLFYILSQLVPITILFCLVIVLDVDLASGSVSGVIFYAQMFDQLLITGNGFIWFGEKTSHMLNGLRLILEMFSLNFFALDVFSFCLWEGAGFLDVVAFRYVSVIYSLLLVCLTVKVVLPLFKKLRSFCRKKFAKQRIEEDHTKSSKSIIHGLTSFLVLCYSQTTVISFNILAHANLYGRGGAKYESRVFFNGELKFFRGRHLYYALPASFFLVVVTVVPPLLLLSYPLCYRVLALCRIQESRFTRLLCKAIPLEKYKPLFDSFQGSFKDEHRYFAGLQFLFRLMIITTFSYIRRFTTYCIFLQIELVTILMLYAFIQPHKKAWHNRIDSFVVALLAIVNAYTIYSYNRRRNYHTHTNILFERIDIGTLQVTLLYTPLLYLLCYVAWQGVVAVRKKIRMKKENEEEISLRECNSILESRYSPFKNRVFKNE